MVNSIAQYISQISIETQQLYDLIIVLIPTVLAISLGVGWLSQLSLLLAVAVGSLCSLGIICGAIGVAAINQRRQSR